MKPGYAGFSSAHRDWAQWSVTDQLAIAAYDPFGGGGVTFLWSLDVEIRFASREMSNLSYDQGDLTNHFTNVYHPPPPSSALKSSLQY